MTTGSIFKHAPGNSSASKELVYLGRLVSDKGVDTLIHALLQLKRWNLSPRLDHHRLGIGGAGVLRQLARNASRRGPD